MADESVNTKAPLLQMQGIYKSFPGVQALKNVSLELYTGEVLALLGENGAGKSTLIKILGGAHRADAGDIYIEGEPAAIHSPGDARQRGVAIIYQEFNLIPDLTVYENIFLGREMTRLGFIDAAEEKRQARAWFERIGLDLDPEARCGDLSVAQQQVVEIAKALSVNAKIIVMDEPSAVLTLQEVERLFGIIRDLKTHGIGTIYISHRLEEIFAVADRVLVLRDGAPVGTAETGAITREKLIEMMVGRPLEAEFPGHTARPGKERLRVENLSRGAVVRGVSFSVRAGEVLGVAGLVGAGRSETMRLIFGADPPDSGKIFVDNREATISNPRDAIRSGICLLTEDRKGQGLILIHTCRENFALPNLDQFSRGAFLDQRKEKTAFGEYARNLNIKITSPEQLVMNLSGGNQQKIVLAKWLARNADIIIFDEPTRGIDVGAKYEIYLLINKLVAEGKAVIMVSSELPEILGMSDRIMVMHEGKIKGEITDVANTTQEDILALAIA